MSKTILVCVDKDGRLLEIVAGWDQPFGHYFGYVECINSSLEVNPFGDFVYNSLDDPDSDVGGGFETLDEVRKKMESSLGFDVEQGFWDSAAIKDMNIERKYYLTKEMRG